LTSSLSLPKPGPASMRPEWSLSLGARLRGLELAREKNWLLTWDENHWLYLVKSTGERQGQVRVAGAVSAASCADDGSAYVAVGGKGEVWWLAPDLTQRWQKSLGHKATAVALDPFGQYVAAADAHGGLHLFDRRGRLVFEAQTPRPLQFLAFVPAAPFVIGSADFGLVACFDLAGRCVWRDGLVAHVGSLAVSGDGEAIVLACFTEGLQRYSLAGKNLGRLSAPEPCRLAALDFEGKHHLVAGLTDRLLLLGPEGSVKSSHLLGTPPAAVVLGALADQAAAALPDGTLMGLDVRNLPAR